jgi:hypothetical protein
MYDLNIHRIPNIHHLHDMFYGVHMIYFFFITPVVRHVYIIV